MPAFVNNRVVHLLHWELDNLAWQCLGQPPRRLNQDLAQDLGLSTAPSASAYLRLVAVAPPAEDLIGPAPAPAAAPGDSGAASGGGGGGGGSNGALAALAAKLQPHQRRRCAAQRPGLLRQHGGAAAGGQLVRILDGISVHTCLFCAVSGKCVNVCAELSWCARSKAHGYDDFRLTLHSRSLPRAH